jgi:hypothetical protein
MQIDIQASGILASAGIPAILGLQVWIVRKISSFDVKFSRFDTWAFGPTGQNGINGRVAKAESEIEELKQAS